MSNVKNQLRSISLPSRSHPSTTEIGEALNNVKNINITTDSSESILMGFTGLEELYNCTEDFLKMGSTQQVMSSNGSEFMEEMLEGSLRLMDICSVLRDLMVETQEHVRGVQSCLRRKKVAGGVEQFDLAVSGYVGFRKNMRKVARKLLESLKNIDGGLSSSSSLVNNGEQGEHLVAVIDPMRRVVSVSFSVLRFFLEFLSGRQSNIKSKLVSMIKKKKVHHDEGAKNEFESLDLAICCSGDDLQKKLEEVEMSIDVFEKSLEGLFRRLIRTRASLLNIISH